MTVRERILAIKLLERQENHSEYLQKLGIHVTMNPVGTTDIEEEKRDV